MNEDGNVLEVRIRTLSHGNTVVLSRVDKPITQKLKQ